jgi:hypothetical protein
VGNASLPAAAFLEDGEDRLGRALLFANCSGRRSDLPAGLAIADGVAPLDHGEADAVGGFPVELALPLRRERTALAGSLKILNRLVKIDISHV